MHKTQNPGRQLTVTILSLSLLTVMAGAAVAPALDVIQRYFSDTDQALVQMIISIPALFIALTNLIFPRLCRRLRAKELVLAGLALYVVGGCAAGLFSNIYLVLAFRALVGVGVGIIMPLSTGLLSFYYGREEQDRLMGYSSAMNQLGGVVATLISGLLASLSWRASFLVYLMGLLSVVLCLLFLPNNRLAGEDRRRESGVLRKNYRFVVAMFLSMFTFFVYPSSFAMETAREGIIPQGYIAVIMASMDLVAFVGGLSFVHIKGRLGMGTRFVAPACFFAGYGLLFAVGGWTGALLGSAFVGFANGLEVPFLISTASQRAGRSAATTVVPMLSIALYLAQFLTPMLLSAVSGAMGAAVASLPYGVAACAAAALALWSCTIRARE